MNKREMITKVVLESGIEESIYLTVIDTLEEVLTQEANLSGGRRKMIDFAYFILSRIRNKREKSGDQEEL
ncbi:MAG: hypothetical protein LUF85_01820 [Bacteroides sp.]|nr:hypothetical protein [Bacteroides sp.]